MRHYYQTLRYAPGSWNGLGGGRRYAQYFNMKSPDRVDAMMAITHILRKCGIEFSVSRYKDYYRVMVSEAEYKSMTKWLKCVILYINGKHKNNW